MQLQEIFDTIDYVCLEYYDNYTQQLKDFARRIGTDIQYELRQKAIKELQITIPNEKEI